MSTPIERTAKLYDVRFPYTTPTGLEARCRVQIYQVGGQTIILATQNIAELPVSITNNFERVATAVCRHFEIDPRKMTWIECYPPYLLAPGGEQTLVRFEVTSDGRIVKPTWIPTTCAEVEARVGESLELLRG